MKTISRSPLLVLLALLLANTLAAIDLKTPPQDNIYDPNQILEQGFRTSIVRTINYERTKREFEIFVVLFAEEPSQGAEVLAQQAGESWSAGKYWTVVYQVGAEAEPNCIVGGDYMDKLPDDLVARTVRGARGTALLVTTPQNRLREFVNNLGDEFSFLRIQAKENYKTAVAAFDAIHAAKQKRKETIQIIIVTALILLVASAVGGFVFWKKHLRKRQPLLLPLTSPRRRLSAPFSGGGDVLVSYGRKH